MAPQQDPPPQRPPPASAEPSDPTRPDAPVVVPKDVPLTSIVVEDIGPVTPDTGVADVLLGSVALVGAMLLASLLLGALVGAVLVYVKHRLGFGGPDADRAEHVSLGIGKDPPPGADP